MPQRRENTNGNHHAHEMWDDADCSREAILGPINKGFINRNLLVNAYNGTNAIITGMAQTDIQLMKVNKAAHPFMPGLPLLDIRGDLRRVLFRYQRSAIIAASVAIIVAIRVVPTISVALAE